MSDAYSVFKFDSFETKYLFFKKFNEDNMLGRLLASVTNDDKVLHCIVETEDGNIRADYYTAVYDDVGNKEEVLHKSIHVVDNSGIISVFVRYEETQISAWYNTPSEFICSENDA